jgi:hypothetical protein
LYSGSLFFCCIAIWRLGKQEMTGAYVSLFLNDMESSKAEGLYSIADAGHKRPPVASSLIDLLSF